MKQHDIVTRIRSFVEELDRRTQQAVKKVMLPATLGVGLALAPGCGPDDDPGQNRARPTQAKADLPDGGGMVALYAAPFPGPDAGVPAPQPEYAAPFPDGQSCVGHCGDQAPAGCWCDDGCTTYGDCCTDKAQACDSGPPVALYAAPFPADAGPAPDSGGPVALYAAPFPGDTCVSGAQAYCGTQAPAGCWCDDQCATYGDCCPDKQACEITALYAAPFPE